MRGPTKWIDPAVARIRRDAYTGANRCWVCTGLNLLILASGVIVATASVGPLPAGLLGVVGVAAIWLRGYLVPYTSRLTPPLLAAIPERLRPHDPAFARFGRGSVTGTTQASADDTTPAAERTVDETLVNAGVLVEDGDELVLSSGFGAAWTDAQAAARPIDPDRIADELPAAVPWVTEATAVREGEGQPGDSDADEDGRRWIRLSGESDAAVSESWLSVPAAVADLTAVRTLERRTDLTATDRTLAAPTLRLFLETCPACGGPLVESGPDHCCGSPRNANGIVETVLGCPDCDEPLAVLEGHDPVSQFTG
jgi:hypothetical protein